MVSKINTFAISGIDAIPIVCETFISKGIPDFEIVGLGSEAVRESRKRIRAAIINQGFTFPNAKVTVNLAPADIRKQGTSLDLALALGLLSSMNVIKPSDVLKRIAVSGELSLDGEIRPIKGALSMAVSAYESGSDIFLVPKENAPEAQSFEKITVLAVSTLKETVDLITSITQTGEIPAVIKPNKAKDVTEEESDYDFSNIIGQEFSKRAIEIAAAGGHNLLMLGSAGAGKTVMARCIKSIMPDMDFDESFVVTKTYSIAGLLDKGESLVRRRPFRMVNTGITRVALIGGGRPLMPGEISLADKGVLFMDEFNEIGKNVVESLRQPLEDKIVRVNNYGTKTILPADFMLVAAMNPCPCGKLYEGGNKCTCSKGEIRNHLKKLSVPILDRIDVQIPVKSIETSFIENSHRSEPSSEIKKRVALARKIQSERYEDKVHHLNGNVSRNALLRYCVLDTGSKRLLGTAAKTMGLSMRGYEKTLRVARTIADLDHSENICEEHLAEAIQYRLPELSNLEA